MWWRWIHCKVLNKWTEQHDRRLLGASWKRSWSQKNSRCVVLVPNYPGSRRGMGNDQRGWGNDQPWLKNAIGTASRGTRHQSSTPLEQPHPLPPANHPRTLWSSMMENLATGTSGVPQGTNHVPQPVANPSDGDIDHDPLWDGCNYTSLYPSNTWHWSSKAGVDQHVLCCWPQL